MDEHALSVLGFADLLQLIARYAQTDTGREVIRGARPGTQLSAITAQHGLYKDAMDWLATRAPALDLQFSSISDLLRRVAPEGAALGGDDLVRCAELLELTDAVKKRLQQQECRPYTHLRELGAKLDPCPELLADLRRCLDDEGSLRDSASPRLRELRKGIRAHERRIQRILERILRVPESAAPLQEKFITQRNGRFVVPVRRDMKADMPGVIHDHSNSGQTVFVEPSETLPLGNDLADLKLEERDESLRILAALSDDMRGRQRELEENEWALSRLDACMAVAGWAADYDCVLPRFSRCLRLIAARHPLLQAQFRHDPDGRHVVPLDLQFPAETNVMVVTGSNSGGKTVALKTAGLLALAAQSGLPVPVDASSEFEIFRQVFADIGDEQSLAQNLSTFTAHIAQITRVLRNVRQGRSLVLLDELGAGTDPLEGGALACAVLQELAGRNALTLATTHLGVVKTFVHENKRMANAAVRFNSDTLEPEYALDIGRPGASHALRIAKRAGVPGITLETAEKMLSSDHLRLEGMLAEMEEEQRLISAREHEAHTAMAALTRDKAQLHDELEKLRRERRRLLHDAYQQAGGIVDNTRRQMEQLLRDLKRSQESAKPAEDVRELRETLATRRKKLEKVIDETATRPAAPLPPRKLQAGQCVWVEKLNSNARILSLSEDRSKADVDVGGIRFTVSVREIGEPTGPEPEAAEKKTQVSRPRPTGHVPREINLIGLRVDEALPKLDKYLDRALLANLPEVRIVHGFGTGRLQQAVHEHLGEHELVSGFRLGKHGEDPGGAGATLAVLGRG